MIRTRGRARRGVQSFELALTLPLWFSVVVGIVDTSSVLGQRANFAAAVEAGCRAGALTDPGNTGGSLPAVQVVVEDRMIGFLGVLDQTACPSCDVVVSTTGAAPARRLVCTGSREVSGISSRWFGTFTVSATRTARLEWQREVAP